MSGHEYTFGGLFTGTLSGILLEEDYDTLACSLEGCFYAVDWKENHVARMMGNQVGDTMNMLKQDVCGRKALSVRFPFTYVHTLGSPKMIKLYNPADCGSGCSTSSPSPWWVFSVVAPGPGEIEDLKKPSCAESKGFLARLIGK
ncbi:MAG: hypothetical protein HY751_06700 [Nitrospinae bacterium]|nr:hypothetical protein [Nitrospinota bacterium]